MAKMLMIDSDSIALQPMMAYVCIYDEFVFSVVFDFIFKSSFWLMVLIDL